MKTCRKCKYLKGKGCSNSKSDRFLELVMLSDYCKNFKRERIFKYKNFNKGLENKND